VVGQADEREARGIGEYREVIGGHGGIVDKEV